MLDWKDLKKHLPRSHNIKVPNWTTPSWKPGEVPASLDVLREYVENDVQAAIDWYYAKKQVKVRASVLLRGGALLFLSVGGLLPIMSAIGTFFGPSASQLQIPKANQWGYLAAGLGAAFVAFDKYFGCSTGWMRYITTAMSLETALRSFRLDWARMTSGLAGEIPSAAVLEGLLQKIFDLSAGARALVEKETQGWVTEFQVNLSQLEKDAKAAVDSARAAVEMAHKESKAVADSTRPGAIDLVVENVLDSDHGYSVSIDGKTRKTEVTSKTCAIMEVVPGLHELSVDATLSGEPAHHSQSVTVVAAAAVTVTIRLAKSKAAST
jgi:hypothetical protein